MIHFLTQIFVQEAYEEKKLGDTAFIMENFDLALKHYKKASELSPTDIIFYLLVAQVYSNQEQFDKCIEECVKAVLVGAKNGATAESIDQARLLIADAVLQQRGVYFFK